MTTRPSKRPRVEDEGTSQVVDCSCKSPKRIESGFFSKIPPELFHHILKFLSSEVEDFRTRLKKFYYWFLGCRRIRVSNLVIWSDCRILFRARLSVVFSTLQLPTNSSGAGCECICHPGLFYVTMRSNIHSFATTLFQNLSYHAAISLYWNCFRVFLFRFGSAPL